jgi:hypothetical protein
MYKAYYQLQRHLGLQITVLLMPHLDNINLQSNNEMKFRSRVIILAHLLEVTLLNAS